MIANYTSVAQLVERGFKTFSSWRWNHQIEIILGACSSIGRANYLDDVIPYGNYDKEVVIYIV